MTREQAVQIFEDEQTCSNKDCDFHCETCDLFVSSDELEKAMKVAIRELRTAKWLKEDHSRVEYTAVCSECGYETFWSDAKYFNYCPCCGAKMEIEEYEL